MELSLVVESINQANLSVSDLYFELHCLFIDEDDAIICSIGNYDQVVVEASLLLYANNLTRVPEVLPTGRALLFTFTD